MNEDILLLSLTAASIGFLHTLLGPDHYLPFIVMSRAGKWSTAKTVGVTVLCGVGHVMSSVVVGLLGVVFGFGVTQLELFEGYRGNLAAWLLITFGCAYFLWGMYRAIRGTGHSHSHHHVHSDQILHLHPHEHANPQEHVREHTHDHTEGRFGTHSHNHDNPGEALIQHDHDHSAAHTHSYDDADDHHHNDIDPHSQSQNTNTSNRQFTFWILFTIFVFGPCEPLIPVLMYPAAKSSLTGMILVTTVFGLITITTMLTIVLVGLWGTGFVRLGRAERYTHMLAGATILLCGMAIEFMGL